MTTDFSLDAHLNLGKAQRDTYDQLMTLSDATSAARPPTAWDDAPLTDAQIAAVGWLAIVMNAWNRVAIASHYPVHG